MSLKLPRNLSIVRRKEARKEGRASHVFLSYPTLISKKIDPLLSRKREVPSDHPNKVNPSSHPPPKKSLLPLSLTYPMMICPFAPGDKRE